MVGYQRAARLGLTAVVLTVAVLAAGLGPAAADAATTAAGLVPAQGVLFGAAVPTTGSSQETERVLSEQEAQLGRKLDLHRVYRLWDEAMPDPVLSTDVQRGRTPVLSIKPRYRSGQQVSWAAIARGDTDATIVRQADGLRSLSAPLFLAFHHEPDLAENASYGYGTPAEFVGAWRHYRQVFRDRGVSNVSFVWIMTTSTFGKPGVTDTYYPGDDAVDWMGVDAFNWFGCYPGLTTGWRSLATVTAPFAAWAKPHGKPLMLAEWGSVEDPAQPGRKAGWIRDALALAKDWPQLKAMSYLDTYGSCPWFFDSTPGSLAAYREIGADPWAHPRPDALLAPSTRLGPAPLSVHFDGSDSTGGGAATGSGVASWTIDFGDGSPAVSGTGQPPADLGHTYPAGSYLARLTVRDADGEVATDEGVVRSAAAPVVAVGARDVTSTSATLRAWVSPQGLAATAVFEWGTSTAYGQQSPPFPVAATTGTAALAHPVTGLRAGVRYYLRVTATSGAGTTVATGSFSTPAAPTVGYLAPSGVTKTSAVLNGTVHPHLLETQYHYEWGPTTGYGAQTNPVRLAPGDSAIQVSTALTGLARKGTIHYRLVATNSAGTVRGVDRVVNTR